MKVEIISEKLRICQQALEGVKGKEEMLSVICRYVQKPESRFTYFNYQYHGHSFRGYIYNPYISSEQGQLYGTVFYKWDNDNPRIVRGYPKINYVESSTVYKKEAVVEEKLDGTNIILYPLPDGTMMGKTRAVPRYDLGGYMGRQWNELVGNTGRRDALHQLTRDEYCPVVELYGYLNACEYIDYPTIPIEISGIDIIDMRTHSFMPYEKKVELFGDVGIPVPTLHWRGTITDDAIGYLQHDLEALMGKYEGFIAKTWSELYEDQFMGKIKCDAVRRLAQLRAGGALPTKEIDKAVRKVLENIAMIDSVGELHSMVIEELYSEFPANLVEVSMARIERVINRMFPIDTLMIWSELEKLEDKIEVSIDNKAEVMRTLAGIDAVRVKPSLAYNAFTMYLRKYGRL